MGNSVAGQGRVTTGAATVGTGQVCLPAIRAAAMNAAVDERLATRTAPGLCLG
jgi:hypothetical protein